MRRVFSQRNNTQSFPFCFIPPRGLEVEARIGGLRFVSCYQPSRAGQAVGGRGPLWMKGRTTSANFTSGIASICFDEGMEWWNFVWGDLLLSNFASPEIIRFERPVWRRIAIRLMH